MLHIELLTNDQPHARICHEYWLQDERGEYVFKIKEVAERHELAANAVSNLVAKSAYVWESAIICTRCKKPYTFTTRAQYQNRGTLRNQACSDCLEKEKNAIEVKKKALIEKFNRDARHSKLYLSDTDITTQIYLVSVLQALTNDQSSIIQPLKKYQACTLSPKPDYDIKIIKHLLDKKALLLGYENNMNVITFNSDGITIDYGKCNFELAFDRKSLENYANNLRNDATKKDLMHSQDFKSLCKDIQIHECLAFLDLAMAEHRFNFSAGERTRLTISSCLEKFSPAQTYNIIWRSVKDAAAYYIRSTIPKNHAANNAISSISRIYAMAYAEDWNIKPFHRNHCLPQSALSKIAFNTILGTNDGGFEHTLHTLIPQDST